MYFAGAVGRTQLGAHLTCASVAQVNAAVSAEVTNRVLADITLTAFVASLSTSISTQTNQQMALQGAFNNLAAVQNALGTNIMRRPAHQPRPGEYGDVRNYTANFIRRTVVL